MQKKLLDIICNIKNASYSDSELSELVNTFTKIALHLLSNRKCSISISFSEDTLSDFAIDSILPLLVTNKKGELPLRKVLLSWDKEINDEVSTYYFLYKIINSRIEQEFAKRLKEADPIFGKILRSFNHLVETERISKASWFGIIYLIPREQHEIIDKPIEPDDIESFESHLFQGSNEKIIEKLFSHLTELNLTLAVPLNSLIRKVKHVNATFLSIDHSDSSNEFFEDKLDIQLIVNNSLSVVNKRIDDFYFKKGKFNQEESEIVKKIIKEFSVDLQDGGISRGLYEYLTPHFPYLTKEHFYNKYHQPLDYLLRLLKKEIASRLEEPNN